VENVLENRSAASQLIENEWVRLVVADPSGTQFLYQPDGFVPFESTLPHPIPEYPDSLSAACASRETLEFALLAGDNEIQRLP